jgi:hypothetical protein
MYLTTILTRAFSGLACTSMVAMALPLDTIPIDNMVAREFTASDGRLTTVHVNRALDFVAVPKGTASPRLSPRLSFTAGRDDDYCSETDPTETFGDDAPLASDCTAIKNYMETITGYYTVSPSDFNTPSGWAIIASSGTCSFGVKFQLPADTKTLVIGTNDVHFYVQGYVAHAQNGRIKAVGTISCNNNREVLYLFWGMIHS